VANEDSSVAVRTRKGCVARDAIRGDLELALELFLDASAVGQASGAWHIRQRFDRHRANSRVEEDNFPGILEVGTLDGHLHRGAALADPRLHNLNVLERRGGLADRKGQHKEENRLHNQADKPGRQFSGG